MIIVGFACGLLFLWLVSYLCTEAGDHMRKVVRVTKRERKLPVLHHLRLPFLCVFFLIGITLGHSVAFLSVPDKDLADSVQVVISGDTNTMSVLTVFGSYFRDPLLAAALGFCSFGAWAIPFLLAVQGFSFAFAVSSLAISLENSAIILALFGLRSLLVMICSLLLSHCSFERAIGVKNRETKMIARVAAMCLLLLLIGVVLEMILVPKLLAFAARAA